MIIPSITLSSVVSIHPLSSAAILYSLSLFFDYKYVCKHDYYIDIENKLKARQIRININQNMMKSKDYLTLHVRIFFLI